MSDIFEARRGDATVRVHRQGATVLSYVRGGREHLFVSPAAPFGGNAAIRGGIPVCWPWFAHDQPGPSHGVARNRPWTPLEASEHGLRFELVSDAATEALWPHAFRLELAVELLPDRLRVVLHHHNPTDDTLTCTGALHSYLAVDELQRARIHGLDGARYRDKVSSTHAIQEGPLAISGEIDRIHDTDRVVSLVEPGRRLDVHTSHSTVVVWNPGGPKAAKMPDLGPGTHHRFVCIEAAITDQEVAVLGPGATFELWTELAPSP